MDCFNRQQHERAPLGSYRHPPSGRQGAHRWGEVQTETGLRVTRTAEFYDPASGRFVAAGDMTVARIFHTATLLSNSKVLIAGWEGSAELFDPATNSFTATVGVPAVRFAATATLLADGRVLIAGGESIDYDVFYVGPSELYDPTS